MRKKGFTLIELLVVISIIALLMSILMPSLGRAKALAKDVLCMSNQKQVGLYLSMYANDCQDKLIQSLDRKKALETNPPVPCLWADRLFYEFGNESSSEVFYCASSKLPTGLDKKWPAVYERQAVKVGPLWRTRAEFTYGLRSPSFDWSKRFDTEKQAFTPPLRLSQIKSPSEFMLLTDVTYDWANPNDAWYIPEAFGSHFAAFDCQHSFFMVHSKGANILTADMSVNKCQLKEITKMIPLQGDMNFSYGEERVFIYPDGTVFNIEGELSGPNRQHE